MTDPSPVPLPPVTLIHAGGTLVGSGATLQLQGGEIHLGLVEGFLRGQHVHDGRGAQAIALLLMAPEFQRR